MSFLLKSGTALTPASKPRVVYLSRTWTPGSLPVPPDTLLYLLTEAERMAAVRSISNGPIKDRTPAKETP
jgi:hypothetical protein